MKKYYIVIFMILFLPLNVYAGRGCCSRHGGVCGCSSSGRQVCCDGSLSPSCGCTPPRVYGCTDSKANNYNPNANQNDGSCTYTIYGCTDPKAENYNANANTDDKSCKYIILGCMDSKAQNYNKEANKDDGSCIYKSNTINKQNDKLDNNENDISNSKEEKNAEFTDGSGNYNNTEGGLVTLLLLIVSGIATYFILKKNKNRKNDINNTVMYCGKCGAKVTNNMKYCRECGSLINRKYGYCGNCGNKLSSNMTFCPVCGTKSNCLNEIKDKHVKEPETTSQFIVEDRKIESINYVLPDINMLSTINENNNKKVTDEEKKELVEKVEKTLKSFNIIAKVTEVRYSEISIIVEIELMNGERISKLLSITKELQMGLATTGLEINTSTGKTNTVALEIPNPDKKSISFKEIFIRQKNKIMKMNIPLLLGVDDSGKDSIIDLIDYSNILISGITGTGKTTLLHSMIMSILMTKKPDEIKLALIDIKEIDFIDYNTIPHLICPVINKQKSATILLQKIVNECEKRKHLLEVVGVNNFNEYNQYVSDYNERRLEEKIDKMTYIVVIIDDLFEMMRHSKNEVEHSINLITRYGKDVGVFLIISTQRPSSDIITSSIKNAIPYRISFAVQSAHESRIILETEGAEKINSEGVFIFKKAGARDGNVIKGIYTTEEEISNVVSYIKEQGRSQYDDMFLKINPETSIQENSIDIESTNVEDEELYDEVKDFVIMSQKASSSLLQRKFKIGYNKAANMIDQLEEDGIIGPATGNSRSREVLYKYTYDDKK